ncbi:MAG: hypothetical protein ACYDCS_14145 [Candidatus Dormibacteria bacterium]
MRPRVSVSAALCATVLMGCAGSTATLNPSALGLPKGGKALATVTFNTSPDGGIYLNPDPMHVVMVDRAPGGPLIKSAGATASDWSSLRQFGDFTFVGVTVRNNGAAGSDPTLNEMQIAVDYAPAGTATGPLSHFYHPMFPLAMLSPESSDEHCTLHVDPGQTQVAVLAYPPVSATSSIVWGVFHLFAVRASFGGGLPAKTATTWQLTLCTPPQPS